MCAHQILEETKVKGFSQMYQNSTLFGNSPKDNRQVMAKTFSQLIANFMDLIPVSWGERL
jgi:hypothetical protein